MLNDDDINYGIHELDEYMEVFNDYQQLSPYPTFYNLLCMYALVVSLCMIPEFQKA